MHMHKLWTCFTNAEYNKTILAPVIINRSENPRRATQSQWRGTDVGDATSRCRWRRHHQLIQHLQITHSATDYEPRCPPAECTDPPERQTDSSFWRRFALLKRLTSHIVPALADRQTTCLFFHRLGPGQGRRQRKQQNGSVDQRSDTYQKGTRQFDDGSYQLSHIYDRLFAATSGGERKLSRPFRRRQQPLPKRQQLN